MSIKITHVENGGSPNEEKVWIRASKDFLVKGFAVVDRTFDTDGSLSNEFRHICILPEVFLQKDQYMIVYTGRGTNGFKKYSDSDNEFYAVFWGSDKCAWNNNGGDTATLISYLVVNSISVPKCVVK